MGNYSSQAASASKSASKSTSTSTNTSANTSTDTSANTSTDTPASKSTNKSTNTSATRVLREGPFDIITRHLRNGTIEELEEYLKTIPSIDRMAKKHRHNVARVILVCPFVSAKYLYEKIPDDLIYVMKDGEFGILRVMLDTSVSLIKDGELKLEEVDDLNKKIEFLLNIDDDEIPSFLEQSESCKYIIAFGKENHSSDHKDGVDTNKN